MVYFLILIFLLAPAYVLKFQILRFPTDVLMTLIVLFWVAFAVTLLAKNRITEFIRYLKAWIA